MMFGGWASPSLAKPSAELWSEAALAAAASMLGAADGALELDLRHRV